LLVPQFYYRAVALCSVDTKFVSQSTDVVTRRIDVPKLCLVIDLAAIGPTFLLIPPWDTECEREPINPGDRRFVRSRGVNKEVEGILGHEETLAERDALDERHSARRELAVRTNLMARHNPRFPAPHHHCRPHRPT